MDLSFHCMLCRNNSDKTNTGLLDCVFEGLMATKLKIGQLLELNIAKPSPLELSALALVLFFGLLALLVWK